MPAAQYLVRGYTGPLASGQPVEHGQALPAKAVNPDHKHDARLIEKGHIVDTKANR